MSSADAEYAESANLSEDVEKLTLTSSAQDSASDESSSAETVVTEPDDDVLKSLGSVQGEELLAFFDNVRNTYDLDTDSLDLPQLVVVGSTSCGKSSLLQALTKLPFPVDNGICTSFATETMIHRCDSSLQPHYSISLDTKGKPNTFVTKQYYGDNWADVSQHLKEDLKETFQTLHVSSDSSASDNHLREDVMRVNVYKHGQAHFSVVDIPGLVSGGTASDQRISESLARQYMRKGRAIVLAVIPAVDDIHNQAVLRLVREENAMDRTIGVVTKSDMLHPEDVPKTLAVLKNLNPRHRLELGWFAVRNRTTAEIESSLSYRERDEKERSFFSRRPWSTLNKKIFGVSNLMECLSDTLYRHVRESFPEIQREIQEKLQDSRAELNALGFARDTYQMQASYLGKIQRNYEDLARVRLSGVCDHISQEEDPAGVIAHLKSLEDELQSNVHLRGAEYPFFTDEQTNERLMELFRQCTAENANGGWEEKMRERDDIFAWILRTWNKNPSSGMWFQVPPDFEERLWKVQCSSWGGFAREYLRKARSIVEGFADSILEETCPDDSTRVKIREVLQRHREAAVRKAEKELNLIIEELGIFKTCNRNVMTELRNSHEVIHDMLSKVTDTKLRHVIMIFQNLKHFRNASLWRFIDNVIIQVTDRHLLGSLGLVYCFSFDWVSGLQEYQMNDLVGEDTARQQKRKNLKIQVRGLEEILKNLEVLRSK